MANDKYETTGKIHAITDETTRGKYTSRTIVLATEPGKYEQYPSFEFGGDKGLGQCEGLRVGDTVTIDWNLRGRKYENPTKGTQWFNTLQGWKATLVKDAPRGPTVSGGGGSDDDLPFATCDMAAEPSPLARFLRGAP